MMNIKPCVTALIVGAGQRAMLYASYAKDHPEELKIVGVVEPDESRRQHAADVFSLSPETCFKTVKELTKRPPIAEAVINGTMDRQHVQTTIPLLEKGYDVLLEKPIGINKKEITQLLQAVKKTGRKVMVCHILRYASFYVEIKKRVLAGEIGDIITMHTVENVGYHHLGAAYIRGKWSQRETSSPMLLAKCCHDMDLICWMKDGVSPSYVSSFGSGMCFKPEKAPKGSGTKCLVDCEIEKDCPYSARKNYIEQDLWSLYAWPSQRHTALSIEEKIESLRTDNPYGRCVWRCDNNVVDHQSVLVEFEDGTLASHDMTGGSSKRCRRISIVGTKGEIEGTLEDGWFLVRHPDARKGHEYSETKVECGVKGDGHGGGDMRLVEDFVRTLRADPASLASTDIWCSISAYAVAFAADEAMLDRRIVSLDKYPISDPVLQTDNQFLMLKTAE